MNARLLVISFAMSVTLLCHAEDPPKAEEVARLVRAFVFAQTPNFNTNAEFRVRKLEIKGLWEQMKTEVVYVDMKIKGDTLPPDNQYTEYGFAVYHGGKIAVFEEYSTIMSGLVSNGDFYYTYLWGFGLIRSQVVRLRIAGRKVEISKSAEFQELPPYEDLFVSASPGGKVQVTSGVFRGEFNHCEAPKKDIGFVGEANSSGLQIIDANGKVVTPAD